MKKRSFRSTFVSVILVITVAISIVNLAVYGINIKKIRQVEVLKMKTAGERIDDMITISLNNIKGLKQICCTDNYARNILLKNNEKNDIGTKFENQNYMDNALKHIASIELLEEYKDIALVITDIQMQKMGGLELASYLHKHIPEIDVLILTAFENFDYAREALRYNVKDYIVKPIYKENLLPPVKKVLEKQEEKSRNQEKIKNYYQWEAAKNYFPVKTIVAHEELYKEFFSYNAIHQEEKFCIVVMQEEELVTDVELVNRIIQEKYRGFIKDFFFSKINEEYVMLLSGIECMDNELIVQEKVESMLSYFCTCKHMNITMGVHL